MSARVRFSRVVLSISGEPGGATFTAAAEMARSFDAELAGLFVEDETVLSITDLPFSVEIALAGSIRPYRRSDAERAMRTECVSARTSLEKAARAALVRHSFMRVRGAVTAILEETAKPNDIVMFVEPERAIDRACVVHTAYLAAALASKASLLYVPASARAWPGGIAAVLTGEADREVLYAALRIAAARDAPVTVIAPEGSAWRGLLGDIVSDTGLAEPVIVERRAETSPDALLRLAAEFPDDLLVIAHAPGRFSSLEELRRFAIARRAPLLIVEPEPVSA